MQFLVFHLGKDRYALATHHVVRVLPLLDCKDLPHAPPYVSGLINYHGAMVPVIDLSVLACGAQSMACFNTRIVLVDFPVADRARHELLGLVAERVAGVEHYDPAAFCTPGIASDDDARYLGKVAAPDGNIVQLVEIEHLLPAEIQATLFTSEREHPC